MSTSEYRTGGIRKHSSTDEYNYFRGVAATMELLRCLELSVFLFAPFYGRCSKKQWGNHFYFQDRTAPYGKRKAIKWMFFTMQLAGGNLTYEKNKLLKIGMTGIYYRFSHPYEPDLKKYAKYNLHGNNFYNLGVDYKYRLGKLVVGIGEGAVGKTRICFAKSIEV